MGVVRKQINMTKSTMTLEEKVATYSIIYGHVEVINENIMLAKSEGKDILISAKAGELYIGDPECTHIYDDWITVGESDHRFGWSSYPVVKSKRLYSKYNLAGTALKSIGMGETQDFSLGKSLFISTDGWKIVDAVTSKYDHINIAINNFLGPSRNRVSHIKLVSEGDKTLRFWVAKSVQNHEDYTKVSYLVYELEMIKANGSIKLIDTWRSSNSID